MQTFVTIYFKKACSKVHKGQLISKCLFEKIVWTKIPPKNLIDSALKYCRAESIKFFGGILVQTIFSKRHFEINWPLVQNQWSFWEKQTVCTLRSLLLLCTTLVCWFSYCRLTLAPLQQYQGKALKKAADRLTTESGV